MLNKFASTAFVLLLLFLCCPAATAQESHVAGLTGNEKSGKKLYQRYCIYCHGEFGDGLGENAPWLDPKPRDFTKGTFKCRSTASGSMPLDSDLYESISRGFHASGMPPWKSLTKQQRTQLVTYVKTFSPRFKEEPPAAPLAIPAETPMSQESAQRGAELFQSMNCWSCHGKQGRGNGPSAITLTDNKGNPIRPFDLTSGSEFKCGSTDREMARDLLTGLDGTPMPSFADALKPEQIWDVVHFIHTLRKGSKIQITQVQPEDKPQ
jgi:mono/diheme cytochrome c family protein